MCAMRAVTELLRKVAVVMLGYEACEVWRNPAQAKVYLADAEQHTAWYTLGSLCSGMSQRSTSRDSTVAREARALPTDGVAPSAGYPGRRTDPPARLGAARGASRDGLSARRACVRTPDEVGLTLRRPNPTPGHRWTADGVSS